MKAPITIQIGRVTKKRSWKREKSKSYVLFCYIHETNKPEKNFEMKYYNDKIFYVDTSCIPHATIGEHQSNGSGNKRRLCVDATNSSWNSSETFPEPFHPRNISTLDGEGCR